MGEPWEEDLARLLERIEGIERWATTVEERLRGKRLPQSAETRILLRIEKALKDLKAARRA